MRIQIIPRVSNVELQDRLKKLCHLETWFLSTAEGVKVDAYTFVITDDTEELKRWSDSEVRLVFIGDLPDAEASEIIQIPDLTSLPERIETALNLVRFKQQFFSANDAEPITKLPRHPELLDSMNTRLGQPMGLLAVQIDHASHLYTNLDPVSKTDLLGALAEHLYPCLPRSAEVAILDASCFVIWIEGASQDVLASCAQALISRTGEPVRFRSGQLHLTFSIGHSFEQALTDPSELWRSTWEAREEAIRRGGNQVVAAQQDQGVEHRIPEAMVRDEFSLVLQPQYSTDGELLKGVEALLRWQGLELGNLAPDRFIPVAERSGQMARVGDWVIERASTESTAWLEHLTSPITIGINISPQQFVKGAIKTQIERLTKDNWINPAILEFELTHTNLLQVIDQHRDTLYALRELGIRIAIDNLGTGIVDTEKLLRCPADTLKIDRTLIGRLEEDVAARELVEHICQLGERFSLRVVAVGVETAEQQKILLEMGCPEAQGFFFAEPIALARFQQFLNRAKSA